MESLHILMLAATGGAILSFFLLKGLFTVLKSIVENSKGGLPGLCAIAWLIAMGFIISQRHNADVLLEDLKFWKEPIAKIQSDTFNWQD